MQRIFGLFVLLLSFLPALGASAWAQEPELYRAVAIVTGQGEPNRRLGFRDCLEKVLVRVSGDPRVVLNPAFAAMREDAGRFVASFGYRDRMEGVPIHDEQGTYDRPHDLTCVYQPSVVDGLLARLGSRPWLDKRPVLTVFLCVERGEKQFVLTQDGADGPYMRESFELAAEPMAMRVTFPAQAQAGLDALPDDPPNAEALEKAAVAAGGTVPLSGSIRWSDAELGWIADWRLIRDGEAHRWQVRGVSFDEAFRVAVRGAAQVLSGNGTPPSPAAPAEARP